MKGFSGFPSKMQFTPLPNFFFSDLLPQINDINELKTTLHLLETLYRKRGYPRFVTFNELLGKKSLMTSLKEATGLPDKILRTSLEKATKRGAILHKVLDKDGKSEDIYLLNDESNRKVLSRIESGELSLPGLKAVKEQAYAELEELPDIYTLYEQNIGMLTPIIAEELKEAEKIYPEKWIKEAIKEAVSLNKRSWRYIAAILEHWSAEGRSDGTHQRYSKTDSDKYIKGKYGHMVQR